MIRVTTYPDGSTRVEGSPEEMAAFCAARSLEPPRTATFTIAPCVVTEREVGASISELMRGAPKPLGGD